MRYHSAMHTAPTSTRSRVRRTLFRPLLAVLLLATVRVQSAELAADGYVGAERCASCHEAQFTLWRGSHHDLAMQRPTPETVLGDFNDASFTYNGVTTRFYHRDGSFLVYTDGADGKLTEYAVAWVFGVYPLQQYLLPTEGGRLQALSIAWDARPQEQGGQRWYHLYPDEGIDHQDPLHWTGPYQNWNTRCAECHSTHLEKRYDAGSRSFSTRFTEEDVACEACHGPGRAHVERAEKGLSVAGSESALQSLQSRGDWAFATGDAIARRTSPLAGREQIDSCGRCHARRGTLGAYEHGQPLSDTHRLSLLGQPLYHHDGQILDEVYVYGSFLQSRMQRAGVVCSNCHEPHSNALRAEGNGVCAQCHRAEQYDRVSHHQHPVDSEAARCVSCHMPERVYMGVDARRDHSMRVPRPDLTLMIDTPNACNDCHTDRDAQWALDALHEWGSAPSDTGSHPALAMEAVSRGDVRGVPGLLELAADEQASPLWRATALERAAESGSRESLSLAASLLASDDPLLRVSAVRAAQQLAPQERFRLLYPLRNDPVTGVRMEVAAALAGIPFPALDEPRREQLRDLFNEYLAIQRLQADMPSVQLQLGLFHLARQDLPAAEASYREALKLNPQLLAARLNLADLLRAAGRDEEARQQLTQALQTAPASGSALHALGLLEARAGNRDRALDYLRQAAALESAGYRHRYVYAVALHDFGDPSAATAVLEQLHRALPAQEEVLLALVNYHAAQGQEADARRFAQKLLALSPDNPAYRRLGASVGAGTENQVR